MTTPPTPKGKTKVPSFSIGYLDRRVSPSNDFYRFACGGWLDKNRVPPDKVRWGAFGQLLERNFEQVGEVLRGAAGAANSKGVERMVGDFFVSATDMKVRDSKGFRPLGADIRRIEAASSPDSLADVVARFHDAGVQPLFEARVRPDNKDSSRYALYLSQGGLALPDRDYYLKRDFRDLRGKYLLHIAKTFRALGEPGKDARASAADVLRIETALARSSRSRTDLRDPYKNYNRLTPGELAKREPGFPWRRYFARRRLEKLPYLVVGQPEFMDSMSELVAKTGDRGLGAYLKWTLVHSSASCLHRAAVEEDFDFFGRILLGQEKPQPDWKLAANTIDSSVGEALGQLYVKKYFPPEARAKVLELVEDIKEVFRDRLRSIPWMTEDTREVALSKFERFTTKIGHPDRFRDYSRVVIARDDYLGNVRRSAAFEISRKKAQVGRPVDRTEWQMTPPTVNAYFNPNFNEIVFPAGILQPPFFDPTMDDAVNLGGIGVVIGHEITHGYDDNGRKFDPEGNLRNWWSKRDGLEFEARAKMIEKEYSEFEPLPGMKVNGLLTRGENIADLGGVRIAYEALRRRLEDGRTPNEKLDGFTPQQRFFMSFAQIHRSKMRDDELKRRLTVDTHSPGEFRVKGPLMNIAEFWEAFEVPEGSKMRSPEGRRVEIW